MATSPYPVVRELALTPAQRRLFGRSRDLTSLPAAEPGTVLVFEVSTGHIAVTERRHLHGREDLVVDAVSVSLVSTRSRTVVAQLGLPSRSAADDFSVLVDFRCCVEDPEVVAAAGLTDLTGLLRSHLRQDTALAQVTATRSVEEINEVRQEVEARIRALCQLRPPHIDGMSIRLQGVRVLTPVDLVKHERHVRDKVWQHRVQDLENQYEDGNARRLGSYFEGGPTAVAGLAASRGDIDLAAATAAAYDREAEGLKNLIEVFKSLPPEIIDTMPVDTSRILESLVDRVAGPARELGPAQRDLARPGITAAGEPPAVDGDIADRRQPDA